MRPAPGDEAFKGLLGDLFDSQAVWRLSRRSALARVRLSGTIADDEAADLFRRSGFDAREICDINAGKVMRWPALNPDGASAKTTS